MFKTVRDAWRQQLYNKLTEQTTDIGNQTVIDEQTARTVLTQSVLDSKHPHLNRLRYSWQADNSPHYSQLGDKPYNIFALPSEQYRYRSNSQHSNQQKLTPLRQEGNIARNSLETNIQAAHQLQTHSADCTQQTLATCKAQHSNAHQGHMADRHVDRSAKGTTDLHCC